MEWQGSKDMRVEGICLSCAHNIIKTADRQEVQESRGGFQGIWLRHNCAQTGVIYQCSVWELKLYLMSTNISFLTNNRWFMPQNQVYYNYQHPQKLFANERTQTLVGKVKCQDILKFNNTNMTLTCCDMSKFLLVTLANFSVLKSWCQWHQKWKWHEIPMYEVSDKRKQMNYF